MTAMLATPTMTPMATSTPTPTSEPFNIFLIVVFSTFFVFVLTILTVFLIMVYVCFCKHSPTQRDLGKPYYRVLHTCNDAEEDMLEVHAMSANAFRRYPEQLM